MSHLPEHVPEAEISEMFQFADKDSDGRISYEEFLVGLAWVLCPELGVIDVRYLLVDDNARQNTRDSSHPPQTPAPAGGGGQTVSGHGQDSVGETEKVSLAVRSEQQQDQPQRQGGGYVRQ